MKRSGEAGFTLIEVMIAVLITAIGVAGIIGLTTAETRSGLSARHTTEAAVLAESKSEELRTVSLTTLATTGTGSDSSPVDVEGVASGNAATAIYTRVWSCTITTTSSLSSAACTVQVSWLDDGGGASSTCSTTNARCVSMYSERSQ